MSGIKSLAMRAGVLCFHDGQLVADRRRGTVQMLKSAGTPHVQLTWRERLPDASDDDVAEPEITVTLERPDCASFKMIPGKREFVFSNGRGHDLFFWAQESDRSTDAQYAEAFAAFLRQQEAGVQRGADSAVDVPDAAQPAAGEAGLAAQEPPVGAAHQLLQETAAPAVAPAGGAAAAVPPPAAAAPAAERQHGPGAVQASDLAAILSNMGVPAPAAPDPRLLAALLAGAASGQQRAAPEGPSLAEVLRPEAVLPLLRDPNALPRLAPHLPEEHRSQAGLEAMVASGPFRGQLEAFGAALQAGQLDLSQFGLQAEGYSVLAFLESIQRQVDRERQGGAGPP